MRQSVLDLLYQTEGTSELISRDGTNVSVALKTKLNSKKLLKHVLLGTSVKQWKKAVSRKNQRTSEDRTISVMLMKMIFDSNTGSIGRSGRFKCGDSHLACVILIEVFVVSTVTK